MPKKQKPAQAPYEFDCEEPVLAPEQDFDTATTDGSPCVDLDSSITSNFTAEQLEAFAFDQWNHDTVAC